LINLKFQPQPQPQQNNTMPNPINTPDLKALREDLGIKQEAQKPTVETETPKTPDGQVDLDAIAAKARAKKKD